MKSKIFISLLLAMIMIAVLATPAFAGKPTRGLLQYYGDPLTQGKETIAIQATHDNHLKVTVVLKGATPGYMYTVEVTGAGTFTSQSFEVNDRGVGRWSGITNEVYTSATTSIRVYLYRDSTLRFYSPYLSITFK